MRPGRGRYFSRIFVWKLVVVSRRTVHLCFHCNFIGILLTLDYSVKMKIAKATPTSDKISIFIYSLLDVLLVNGIKVLWISNTGNQVNGYNNVKSPLNDGNSTLKEELEQQGSVQKSGDEVKGEIMDHFRDTCLAVNPSWPAVIDCFHSIIKSYRNVYNIRNSCSVRLFPIFKKKTLYFKARVTILTNEWLRLARYTWTIRKKVFKKSKRTCLCVPYFNTILVLFRKIHLR